MSEYPFNETPYAITTILSFIQIICTLNIYPSYFSSGYAKALKRSISAKLMMSEWVAMTVLIKCTNRSPKGKEMFFKSEEMSAEQVVLIAEDLEKTDRSKRIMFID